MDDAHEERLVAGDRNGRADPARVLLVGPATPTEAARTHQDQAALAPHAAAALHDHLHVHQAHRQVASRDGAALSPGGVALAPL